MSIESIVNHAAPAAVRSTFRSAVLRHLVAGVTLATLTACGAFSSKDDAPAAPADLPARPGTPDDNAKPPTSLGGAPPSGIFVSSSRGTDDGSGTSGRPLKSLKAAFDAAKAQNLRVIACAEEYAENIEVLNGVSAYGYYDCSQSPWAQSDTAKAVVRAPNSPAMIASGISLPTRFEGFEIHAPDLDAAPATETDGTSIALDVRQSTAFTLAKSLLHAGRGAPGTDGTAGPMNSVTSASNGVAANDQNYRTCQAMVFTTQQCLNRSLPGPSGGVTNCAIGAAGGPGGEGGPARWWIDQTESGASFDPRGFPYAASATTAAGGENFVASGDFAGGPGAAGQQGAAGSDGANGSWSLTTTQFVRGNGNAGGAGAPGQGGGGGASTRQAYVHQLGGVNTVTFGPPPSNAYYATASGAGGGAGGCAGQPGTPGSGGGASIGALVIDSTVTFDTIRVESSAGGRAGKGTLGTPGIGGSAGGLGISVAGVKVTGSGGNGGPGGDGGVSGHGAPGPSIALAFSKTRPTTTQVELVPGPAGEGQPEITVGSKTLPAVKGDAVAEYEIKP